MVIFLRVVFISGLLGYFISKQNIVRCRDCQCYFSDFLEPPGGFPIREVDGRSGFKGRRKPPGSVSCLQKKSGLLHSIDKASRENLKRRMLKRIGKELFDHP
jgi:hypothetical protein